MSTANLFSLIKFNEVAQLKKETKEFLTSKMKSDKFTKKQEIYTVNNTCDRIFVIKKGLVRGYTVINNIEITSWVSIENEVFTSISGYFSQQSCKETIQALEDTYVDYLEFQDMEEALSKFPDFANLNRRLMEEYYYAAEVRSIIPRIPGAKDRINYFLTHYNQQIIERTPKKILASLLNMRPETLSRLIKENKFEDFKN
jgi:CRP-like cAMP-binding protein